MSSDMDINDNAKAILENLQKGIISPEDITKPVRQLCVEYLRRAKKETTQEEMASLFQMTVRTIQNDVAEIKQNYANMLTFQDARRIVGGLIDFGERLKQWAVEKSDYRLAWDIEMDMVDKLMALGFLKRAPEEILLKNTEKVDELTPDEAKVIDDILLKVAERRNKRENERLLGGGEKWLGGVGQD